MVDFHKHFPHSGVGKVYPWLKSELETLKPGMILDYGCGKGGTALWLESEFPGVHIERYDPYVQAYNTLHPGAYEWIYSGDVLEHIPTEELPDTIQSLAEMTHTTSHIIDLDPAKKSLPDGRNAHLSLLTPDHWQQLFERHYDQVTAQTEYYGTRRRLHLRGTHAQTQN